MVGLKLFNQIGQNHVLNPINEARGLLYHMQEQVESIKRREKLRKMRDYYIMQIEGDSHCKTIGYTELSDTDNSSGL